MNAKDRATIARSINRLAPLGLRVLLDCGTGVCHVYDMAADNSEFGRYSIAELDRFLNPA